MVIQYVQFAEEYQTYSLQRRLNCTIKNNDNKTFQINFFGKVRNKNFGTKKVENNLRKKLLEKVNSKLFVKITQLTLPQKLAYNNDEQ